jgi:hypothetical protein
MRSNRNSILRRASGEGKSGERSRALRNEKTERDCPGGKRAAASIGDRQALRALGDAEDFFRQVGSDWNAKFLPLVGLHH